VADYSSSSSSKITRKKNEIIVGKSSGLAEKSKNRLRKHQEKHESEREKARHDAVVEISMNSVLNLRPGESEQADPPPVSKANDKAKAATQADVDSGEDSGVNSEVEEQEQRLTEKKRKGKGKARDQSAVKPFAQRDLVSLAFAGDKVVQVCFPPKYCTETGAFVFIFSPIGLPRGQTTGDPRRCTEGSGHNPAWMGAFPFPTFAPLSESSLLNPSRARGVGLVRKKHHRSRSSSKRSLASTLDLEKTMEKLTSSFLRNGTRRLRSIWSRTYPIPIQARRSTRGAYRHRLGRNGTPGLGSRGKHCQGWLRRCVLLHFTTSTGSLC
jgi:hypothetical protein